MIGLRLRKLRLFLSLFTAFTALSCRASYLLLQLLLLQLRVRLWRSVQTWRFRRACARYVKGAYLGRLSAVYRSELQRVVKQLSVAQWLDLARSPAPGA